MRLLERIRKSKVLSRYLLPLALLSAFLTVIGLITDTVLPISLGGLVLLTPLFLIFLFTDRLAVWLKAIRENQLSYKYFAPNSRLQESIAQQINSSLKVPIGITLIIRALLLSLISWLVDLFSSLIDGGILAVFGHLREKLLIASASLTLAAFDLVRRKPIKTSVPLRIVSIVGAFAFFRGFLLLMSGLDGFRSFVGMKALFSSPIWFLFKERRNAVITWSNQVGVSSLILTSVFALITVAIGLDILKHPTTEENVDIKNFALAFVITSAWMGTQILVYPFNGLLQ